MLRKKTRSPKKLAGADDLRYIEDLGHHANIGKVKRRKKRYGKKILTAFTRLLALGIICYLICVYSNFPFIAKWRTIYIETAMSTMTHQWLATYFIPSDVVNEVYANMQANKESQSDLESSWDLVTADAGKKEELTEEPKTEGSQTEGSQTGGPVTEESKKGESKTEESVTEEFVTEEFVTEEFVTEESVIEEVAIKESETEESETEESETEETVAETMTEMVEVVTKSEEELFYERFWEVDTPEFRAFLEENPRYTRRGYSRMDIEDLEEQLELYTVNGDPVLAVDVRNNLLLIGIHGPDYHGKLAIVKNPAQVDLAKAENLGEIGDLIFQFGENENAMVAVNASRFQDEGGVSYGGVVAGSLVIDGVDYGRPHKGSWKYFGMKYDNLFYITNYKSANVEDYRWAVECYPALVVNGENVAEGSFGMGIQPRTAVGQTRTGDFMLLVVDGRQMGYSLGCEIGECSEIMIRYGCFQGADMDGGSSSVMWYKGEVITRSCSATGIGRYTPDAVVIRYANDPDVVRQKNNAEKK